MGGILKFLGRHVIASLIGAAGVIIYILGVADQAEKISTSFKPWQLQGTGALLFVIFVVLVLASYDKEHRNFSRSVGEALPAVPELTPKPVPAAAPPNPDPDHVPQSVVDEYLKIKESGPTEIQEARFLRQYQGKWISLKLQITTIEPNRENIMTLFHVGKGVTSRNYIIAYFDHKWEDHFHNVNIGDMFSFKGKISVPTGGGVRLESSEPL